MKNMITISAIALGFLGVSPALRAALTPQSCPTGYYDCPACAGCIQNGTPCNSSSCNAREILLSATKDVYVLDSGVIVSCQPDHALKPLPTTTENPNGVIYWSCQQGVPATAAPQKKP